MSSRVDLPLRPSLPVGAIAGLPWLALTVFVLVAALTDKTILLLALPVLLVAGLRTARRHGALAGDDAIVGLRLENNHLSAQFRHRPSVPVLAARSSLLGPTLTVLKLHPLDTRYKSCRIVLLAPTPWFDGNTDADAFRRLRQWLRLGQHRQEPVT